VCRAGKRDEVKNLAVHHQPATDDRAALGRKRVSPVWRTSDLHSRTATKLVREWIDLHVEELSADWALAQAGREVEKIALLE